MSQNLLCVIYHDLLVEICSLRVSPSFSHSFFYLLFGQKDLQVWG